MLTASELIKKIENHEDIYILDVRTDPEVKQSRIKGSHHIILNDLPNNLDKLPKDKLIIAYCHTQARSKHAVNLLKEHGFNVDNLEAGIKKFLLSANHLIER